MTRYDHPQPHHTLTDRIDQAVLSIATSKPRLPAWVTAFFAIGFAYNTLIVVRSLVSGSESHIGRGGGSLIMMGMFIVPLWVLANVASARKPGRSVWAALLVGGLLIAAGPALVISQSGVTGAMYVQGRRGGSWGSAADMMWIAWGLAMCCVVPGMLGLVQGMRRR